jgi:hypothetical protein
LNALLLRLTLLSPWIAGLSDNVRASEPELFLVLPGSLEACESLSTF